MEVYSVENRAFIEILHARRKMSVASLFLACIILHGAVEGLNRDFEVYHEMVSEIKNYFHIRHIVFFCAVDDLGKFFDFRYRMFIRMCMHHSSASNFIISAVILYLGMQEKLLLLNLQSSFSAPVHTSVMDFRLFNKTVCLIIFKSSFLIRLQFKKK